MFFWMIVFYCFYLYCARNQYHLEYTGYMEGFKHKKEFDHTLVLPERDADPLFHDEPTNMYHELMKSHRGE